ncbi:MAG: OadG family protein [Alistipes sp.]|nr:OadG family protein [Alistipes sp.]MBR2881384.1 OadG family protein [Prevotella sp.]
MMILATNWGIASLMALVSIMLVFVVLVLLICVLKLFGVIFSEKKRKVSATTAAASSDGISDEEVAAIAMAVNLFFNRHDEESDVLTFRQNHDVSAWQVRNINKQL